MFKLLFTFLTIFLPFLCISQATLSIHIEGLKEVKGDLYIGLYNSESTFKNTDSVFMKQIIPVDSLVMLTTMKNVPAGDYALTLFHDENSNGKLDKGLFGKPKEKYGFSNNPGIFLKSPGFDKCQFTVKADTQVVIQMK